MTVTRMRQEMNPDEFAYWGMYYARKAQQEQLAMKMG